MAYQNTSTSGESICIGGPSSAGAIRHLQPVATHARLYIAVDQDVTACIHCHQHFPNNTQLVEHGKQDEHRPYGCVCGHTFTQLNALERHIASKNGVARFPCFQCQNSVNPKSFTRADHLLQHQRTFHKSLPAATASYSAHDNSTENPPSPQYTPLFPCLVPGCDRVNDRAYNWEADLDAHMNWAHSAPQGDSTAQQEPGISFHTWVDDGSQQGTFLHVAHSDAPITQSDGFIWPGADRGLQPNESSYEHSMAFEDVDFQLDGSLEFGEDIELAINIEYETNLMYHD